MRALPGKTKAPVPRETGAFADSALPGRLKDRVLDVHVLHVRGRSGPGADVQHECVPAGDDLRCGFEGELLHQPGRIGVCEVGAVDQRVDQRAVKTPAKRPAVAPGERG